MSNVVSSVIHEVSNVASFRAPLQSTGAQSIGFQEQVSFLAQFLCLFQRGTIVKIGVTAQATQQFLCYNRKGEVEQETLKTNRLGT